MEEPFSLSEASRRRQTPYVPVCARYVCVPAPYAIVPADAGHANTARLFSVVRRRAAGDMLSRGKLLCA